MVRLIHIFRLRIRNLNKKSNVWTSSVCSTQISTCPRANKEGRVKCRRHVPFQRSKHREQFRRRADTYKNLCPHLTQLLRKFKIKYHDEIMDLTFITNRHIISRNWKVQPKSRYDCTWSKMMTLMTLHSTMMILPLLSTQTPRGCWRMFAPNFRTNWPYWL